MGASRGRILFRHILPNTLTPVLVQSSYDVGAAILTVAGLSFIGFGAQPPTLNGELWLRRPATIWPKRRGQLPLLRSVFSLQCWRSTYWGMG